VAPEITGAADELVVLAVVLVMALQVLLAQELQAKETLAEMLHHIVVVDKPQVVAEVGMVVVARQLQAKETEVQAELGILQPLVAVL
jgi:hypothetical protein